MSQLVTIYGGSGFVGRYIARRMAKLGWRVRVAVRRPNEAIFVKPYGTVGQVEPVLCNIRDDRSVAAAMAGADAVVNCVGTFDARGKNNFDAVQHEGAERIARLAAEASVARLVHISSIGADPDAESDYARTKGEGEQGVLSHFPSAVILRPSVVFGAEDEFFNRFAGMARISPIVPVVGGTTRFQPVFVDDIAAAAEKAIVGEAASGIYELGGPEAATFSDLIHRMLDHIRRRRVVVNLPFWLASFQAATFDFLSMITLGLFKAPITGDQVKSLRQDNVVSDNVRGFADLGISPTAMEAVLPDYLWRFRPSGQYDEIKESAGNLKA